jgi:hypothetical protein
MIKEPLVSNEERENMPFYDPKLEPKNIRRIKLVNLEKVVAKLREERKANNQSMIINLEPIKEERFKDPSWSLTFSKDPETGIFYGIVNSWYEDGNPKWSKIIVNEFRTLNLAHDGDAKVWACLRMHECVENSPLQMITNSDPILRVNDPEVEAVKKINKGAEIGKAIQRVELLKGEKLVSFARMLGILVGHSTSPKELHGAVMERAYNDAEAFNQKWDDGDRNVKELFSNAYSLGVIKLDHSKGYFYENIPLGMSEPAAIAYLKNESDIMVNIGTEAKRKDEQGKRIAEENEPKEFKVEKTKEKVK